MRKSLLFSVHAVSGLLAGLFILLMSVSGAVLVFEAELDKLQYPGIQLLPGRSPLLPDSAYAAVRNYFPGAQISSVLLPENNSGPFIFNISKPGNTHTVQVFLHPQTAQLLATRGGSNDISHHFTSWLKGFHSSFHLGKTGEWLLGFFALLFLLSLLTGFMLYQRKIFPVITFNRVIYKRANLHQLIGTWALLFNLMIATSGFWMQRYVFKKSFYAASVPYAPVIKPSAALPYSIARAIGGISASYPAFTPYVLYFPATASGKTAVYGSRITNAFIHSKKYADRIMLDSAGNITSTAFVTDIDAADRYDIINAQIHYGRYGGWPVKLLYVLFGLSGAILSITGFILWIRKKPAT